MQHSGGQAAALGRPRLMGRAGPSVKDLKSSIILDHGWFVYINATSTAESGLKTIGYGPLSASVVECRDGNVVKSKVYRLSR